MDTKATVKGNVISHIKKNIRNGSWKLNEKITSENELCKTLNVSRVSVRSAIKQFIALGILESVHGKGTYLRSNDLTAFGNSNYEKATLETLKEIKDLLEFRCMIEPEICAQVAPIASQELIEKLSEYLNAMENSRDNNEVFVDMDVKFHMALCIETNNPLLIKIMDDIFTRKQNYYKILNLTIGYYGGIYYHALLVDAIKKRDGKHAYTLMREHLERGLIDVSIDNDYEDFINNDSSEEI